MTTDYEELIVKAIGRTGFSQWLLIIGCHNLTVIASWAMIMMSFAGAVPEYWVEVTMRNSTGNASHVLRLDGRCPNHENETLRIGDNIITTVSQWRLLCSRKWIPYFITTLQMVGAFCGAFIGGQTGESFGRKKTLVVFFTVMLCTTFASAFSNSWQMFGACRFLIGVGLGGILVVVYVLPIEYLTKSWRTVATAVPFWALGVSLFGVMTLAVRNWRTISIITSICGVPFLIMLLFLPESCRWLCVVGRTEEAMALLEQLARWNRRPKPDLSQLEKIVKESIELEKSRKKYTYIDLFRHKETAFKTLVIGLQWTTCGLVYYGMTFGVSNLSGNTSINFILAGLTEAFALFLFWLVSNVLPRKYTTMLWFGLCGVLAFSITITWFAASDAMFKKTFNILAITARLSLAAAWQASIASTNENYPTVVRAAGSAVSMIFARVGSVIAPQVTYLHEISAHLPYTLYGILGMGSALSCLFLKDNKELEDYFGDEQKESELEKTDGIALKIWNENLEQKE